MIDWTDAFDNSGYIAGSDAAPQRWADAAAEFRDRMAANDRAQLDLRYGPDPRNQLDLFLPEGGPKGLVIFVHGGYWQRFDKSYWSHMATGPLHEGWAVAMASYTLAPLVHISAITTEIGHAIDKASELVDGPIHLIGHSAGGHLVARMACDNSPVGASAAARIARIIPVSGVHDLRPLRLTTMNETLKLDDAEASAESPALLTPRKDVNVIFWVGAAERPEFLRQNRLVTEAWSLKGANVEDIYDRGLNHFTVIEQLIDPASGLTQALVR